MKIKFINILWKYKSMNTFFLNHMIEYKFLFSIIWWLYFYIITIIRMFNNTIYIIIITMLFNNVIIRIMWIRHNIWKIKYEKKYLNLIFIYIYMQAPGDNILKFLVNTVAIYFNNYRYFETILPRQFLFAFKLFNHVVFSSNFCFMHIPCCYIRLLLSINI